MARAYQADTGNAKLKYLQLAFRNRMRAQIVEAESTPSEQAERISRKGGILNPEFRKWVLGIVRLTGAAVLVLLVIWFFWP